MSSMVRANKTWETNRLVARAAVTAHGDMLYHEYARDPDVARYMTWRPHRTVDETREFLQRCESAWADGSAFTWALWVKSEERAVGLLAARVRLPSVDIGYGLAKRLWRQGFMSEAVAGIVQWALRHQEIHRVWATCDVDNVASARLLERVGMQREGVLRRWIVHPNVSETPRDCFCYSIVRDRVG